MKSQILNTLRLAFVIKLLAKDQFFTLAPLPEFIQTKNSLAGELDVDITNAPKDYLYKFFIAKNSSELRLGNFYAVEVLTDSDRVMITSHTAYEDQDPVLLDSECTISTIDNNFGCSKKLFDTLSSFFLPMQ